MTSSSSRSTRSSRPGKGPRTVDGALLHELRMPFGYWEAKDEKDDLDAEIESQVQARLSAGQHHLRGHNAGGADPERQEVIRCAVTTPAVAETAQSVLRLRARGDRRVPQGGGAVQDRPAGRARRAARHDRTKADAERPTFRNAAEGVPRACPRDDQPEPGRGRCARDADPAHPDRRDLLEGLRRGRLPPREQRREGALRRWKTPSSPAHSSAKTLRGLEPYYARSARRRRRSAATTRSRPSSRSSTRTSTRSTTRKRPTGWAWSTRPNEIVRFMIEGADWLCETALRQEPDRPRRGDSRPRHRHRHLHLRTAGALPRPAGQAQAQVPRRAARQRSGDPALLRGQPEHRGDLLRRSPASTPSSRTCASSTRSTTWPASASKPATSTTCSACLSDENVERIRRQNKRKISVIIGNPPYNANQANENDNNKNREYPEIDERIKDSYIKASTAQKTKLYDMYARFFRWASPDRLHDDGIIAFVTNRSFIDF
jgi:hypothetical protein